MTPPSNPLDTLEDFLKENDSASNEVSSSLPHAIKIAQGAMEKAFQIGPRVAELGKHAYEWYGFLLANTKDPDYVVRDILLAKNQDVSGAHVDVSGEGVGAAVQELGRINQGREMPYTVVGWIHNHAEFGTFHSGTDSNNMLVVLNSVSLNTEKGILTPLEVIEDVPRVDVLEDKVRVRGTEVTDGAVDYLLRNEEAAVHLLNRYGIPCGERKPMEVAKELLRDVLVASQSVIHMSKIVGFAYSIVVNNRRDHPYTEIAVLEKNLLLDEKSQYTRRIPLEIVTVEHDLSFTVEELDKEIREKIPFPERRTFLQRAFEKRPKFTFKRRKRAVPGRLLVAHSQDEPPVKKEVLRISEHATWNGSLDELVGTFSHHVVSYLLSDRWYHKYSTYMDRVMGMVMMDDRNILDAFKEAGPCIAQDHGSTQSLIPEHVAEILSQKILGQLDGIDDDKKKRILEFMTGVAQSSPYANKIEELIPLFIPYLRGVPEEIIMFGKNLLAYIDRPQTEAAYQYWISRVVRSLADHEGITLKCAISKAGPVYLDSERPLSEFLGSYAMHYQSTFLTRIWDGRYDEEALQFIKGFNNPATRDEAILAYGTRIGSKAQKIEKEEVDRFIEEKHGNTHGNTGTVPPTGTN